MTATEAELLERAVALALANGEGGGQPFGALVVRDGEVLATGVNTGAQDADPTAHAETAAIREACRRLGTLDLGGAVVVSSCEPCPMCRAAARLAGISRIVYAAPAQAAARGGYELPPEPVVEHVPTAGAEEPFARFPARPEAAAARRPVAELRLALTVEEYERALAFYRDALGLPVLEVWDAPEGSGAVLDAGRATLELLSTGQAELVDRVEVGERVAGPVRLALEVADSAAVAEELVAGGAELLAEPVVTPWNHRNVRVRAPDGMQLTLFTVLED